MGAKLYVFRNHFHLFGRLQTFSPFSSLYYLILGLSAQSKFRPNFGQENFTEEGSLNPNWGKQAGREADRQAARKKEGRQDGR